MRKVRLPFVESFPSAIRLGLPRSTVEGNLGDTFYPRLHAIHNNIVEALVHNQTDYLAAIATPALVHALAARRLELTNSGHRLRLHKPRNKLIALRNAVLPQRVYCTPDCYISVACRVYFGAGHSEAPLEDLSHLRVGRWRWVCWDKRLDFTRNLRNLYQQQLYEFVVRFESSHYIELSLPGNSSPLNLTQLSS